jgi:4-hydroxybenzoate polyprenyltransferase
LPLSSGLVKGLAKSLRPHQWTKNGFLFFAPVFAHVAFQGDVMLRVTAAFFLFCALSSTVYLMNDVADLERDRLHPEKKHRPIAAGQVPAGAALAFAIVLGLGALAAAFALDTWFGWSAVAYLANNVLYSIWLKHVVILDVMSIAGGFVIRAVAGGFVAEVPISHWLILCTALLALFLAVSKRRQELTSLAGGGGDHRISLKDYTPEFTDQLISIVTASTLIAYSLYAFDKDVGRKLGTQYLGLTIPFVIYGIFRYLYLVHLKGVGGNPSRVLLKDRPLQINMLLWITAVAILIYGD